MRFLFLGLLLCMMPTAFAQQNVPLRPTIRVAATAMIAAKPDRAEIDIGVITRGRAGRPGSNANAKQVSTVLIALRHAAGEGTDIQTVSYTLTPNYRYATGSEPLLVGYTATNVVRVTLDDLKKVGIVIDAATSSVPTAFRICDSLCANRRASDCGPYARQPSRLTARRKR